VSSKTINAFFSEKLQKKKMPFTKLIVCMLVVGMISCSILIFTALASATDSWKTAAPLPTALSGKAAVVNGSIYVIGNYNSTPFFNPLNYQYNPSTNTWAAKKNTTSIRSNFAVAAYQNEIYLLGGLTNNLSTEEYDAATDTWTQKTPMPTNRLGVEANVVDGKIYVIGGNVPRLWVSEPPLHVNEVYDPASDSWSSSSPIPTAVLLYASAVVDDKIYIIGGINPVEFPNTTLTLVQIFDPKTNQWSQGTPIPTGVACAAAVATTGTLAPKRIYVFGGELFNSTASIWNIPTNLTQVYDPETDTWSTGTPMPTARSGLAVANINDTLYAIGGENGGNYLAANEKYAPQENGSPPPSLSPSPTSSSTATLPPSQTPTASPPLTPQPDPGLPTNLWFFIVVVVCIATVGLLLLVRANKHRKPFSAS
jgi:N-acetylneuraminic acid mutarotase